ncbi:MAG TPA: RluA family pseudouridine synthase [Ignavibacteria bacterium]|nr:RluA family pseudouridine synthase [Ignavibacteria bacterium]
MEKNYKLIVPNIKDRQRIDKYITVFVENATRTKVQKSINMGNVLVNGNLVKSNYILKPYDEIDIELPVPDKQEIVPENIPLDIVFEDEYLLVVNKPAGMVTHPAYKNYSGTLVNAVMFYSLKKKDSLSSLNGFERAGIVHRLDKDTSGLLVIAKDETTHSKLSDLLMRHDIEREYNAIVWGHFRNKEGIIESRLARDRKDRKKVAVLRDDEEGGKYAVTMYEVLKEFEFLSLLRLRLRTGRTHQIRVHLSSKGHPVFGDETYNGRVPHSVNLTNNIKSQIKNLLEIMPRQALHARVLGFVHPRTREKLHFESALPEDMQNVLKILGA